MPQHHCQRQVFAKSSSSAAAATAAENFRKIKCRKILNKTLQSSVELGRMLAKTTQKKEIMFKKVFGNNSCLAQRRGNKFSEWHRRLQQRIDFMLIVGDLPEKHCKTRALKSNCGAYKLKNC